MTVPRPTHCPGTPPEPQHLRRDSLRNVVQLDRKAALHAGTGPQGLIPAPDVRVLIERYLMALVPPCPAENGKIGHRQFASDEFHLRQPAVQHPIEAVRFLRVSPEAINPVRFGFEHAEMMDLAGHRTKTAHLPHQPLKYRYALTQAGRQEPAGLLAKIEQDRARFENVDRLSVRTVGIGERRGLVV